MTTPSGAEVAGLLQLAGIDEYVWPRDQVAIQEIQRDIFAVGVWLSDHLERPIDLYVALRADSSAMRALIQSFAAPMSNELRAAIYCVLGGGVIHRLTFNFDRGLHSMIWFCVDFEDRHLVFKSENVYDADFVRHLGFMKMNDRPFIEGYFPRR